MLTKTTRMLLAVIGLASIGGRAIAAEPAAAGTAANTNSSLGSGIDLSYVDPGVRPQDDFYRAVNGKWLDTLPDAARQGALWRRSTSCATTPNCSSRRSSRTWRRPTDAPGPRDRRRLRDLYTSFMDEATIERWALKPLDALVRARSTRSRTRRDVAALIARFNGIGVDAPFRPVVHQDNRDSTKYVVDLRQGGLGLPDRDYYLRTIKFKDVRTQYGDARREDARDGRRRDAAARTRADILALETALAKAQWTKVENRDPVKTYNKVALTRACRASRPASTGSADLDATRESSPASTI